MGRSKFPKWLKKGDLICTMDEPLRPGRFTSIKREKFARRADGSRIEDWQWSWRLVCYAYWEDRDNPGRWFPYPQFTEGPVVRYDPNYKPPDWEGLLLES